MLYLHVFFFSFYRVLQYFTTVVWEINKIEWDLLNKSHFVFWLIWMKLFDFEIKIVIVLLFYNFKLTSKLKANFHLSLDV